MEPSGCLVGMKNTFTYLKQQTLLSEMISNNVKMIICSKWATTCRDTVISKLNGNNSVAFQISCRLLSEGVIRPALVLFICVM